MLTPFEQDLVARVQRIGIAQDYGRAYFYVMRRASSPRCERILAHLFPTRRAPA